MSREKGFFKGLFRDPLPTELLEEKEIRNRNNLIKEANDFLESLPLLKQQEKLERVLTEERIKRKEKETANELQRNFFLFLKEKEQSCLKYLAETERDYLERAEEHVTIFSDDLAAGRIMLKRDGNDDDEEEQMRKDDEVIRFHAI